MSKKIISIIIAITCSLLSVTASIGFAYDPNGDNFYDVWDIILMRQFINGTATVSNLTPLDYNQNGVITSTDVILLNDDILQNSINKTEPKGDNTSIPEVNNVNETAINYIVSDATTGYLEHEKYYSINCSPKTDNSFSPNNVIGDTDERVVDFSKSGIVKIIVSKSSGEGFGTGFIVAPHVIATAAHVIYDSGTYARNAIIKDVLTFNTDASQKESLTPLEVHYCAKYSSSNNKAYYDYALITVKEDLSNYPMFELGVYDYMLDKDVTATITGFPAKIKGSTGQISVNDSKNLHTMYSGNGIVFSSNGFQINHNIDTTEGNSGSPLYITEYYNNTIKYIAFGIHNIGADNQNSAVQIDSNLINFYKNNTHVPNTSQSKGSAY